MRVRSRTVFSGRVGFGSILYGLHKISDQKKVRLRSGSSALNERDKNTEVKLLWIRIFLVKVGGESGSTQEEAGGRGETEAGPTQVNRTLMAILFCVK